MEKVETIEDFYKNQFDWLPENIRKEFGHFNVFPIKPLIKENQDSIPYKRRDYFKIVLVIGGGKMYYADKVVEVQKQALAFSNPQIPYKWEDRETIMDGFFCIFNQAFFYEYCNLNQYPVFKPGGDHLFELSDEQLLKVKNIYERMFEELNTDYVYKYDVLRNLVSELLHLAMKMQPITKLKEQATNGLQRISKLFFELLERQFPIEENTTSLQLRNASDYAFQLNVHANYLNRAIKETTQKTTSQVIAERILQESKILLKHSQWNISEIAYALGFTEVSHFNNFFKKHTGLNPSKFRDV